MSVHSLNLLWRVVLFSLALVVAVASPFAADAATAAPTVNATIGQRHVLFLSVPLPGHLSPLLSLSAALERRGWRTSLITTAHMQQHITNEAPHLTFIPLHSCNQPYSTLPAALNASAAAAPDWLASSHHLYSWILAMHRCMYTESVQLLANVSVVDMIVVDFASSFGFDVATTLNVPYIVNNCNVLHFLPFTFLPPPPHLPLAMSDVGLSQLTLATSRFWIQRMLYPLIAAAAWAGERFIVEKELNEVRVESGLIESIVVSNDWLKGRSILVNAVIGLEYSHCLPSLIRMTGPLIDMRPTAVADRLSQLSATEQGWLGGVEQRAVYVAFGTIAPLTQTQLRVLYDALAQLAINYTVVWKVSASLAALLPPPPPSLHMTGWVSSQPSLLCHPRMSLFISHCGTHSVHESLYCGVPLLCLPIQGDQQENAHRLHDAHAGRFLSPLTFTPQQLYTHATTMLQPHPTASQYSRNAVRLGGLVRLAGGVEAAADWVEWVTEWGVEGLAASGEGSRMWVAYGWDVMLVWWMVGWLGLRVCRRLVKWAWRLRGRMVAEKVIALEAAGSRVGGQILLDEQSGAASGSNGLRRRRTQQCAEG